MYKLNDFAHGPGMPELVVSEAKDVSGVDLLGLRAPAEAVANRLMNGVTTVTPTIRYISFRSWLILQYLNLGGPNSWPAFSEFAAKAECLIAYATQLAGDSTAGVVGRDGAAVSVNEKGSTLTLKRLTKILATEIYAGSSEALRVGEAASAVPTLTHERGLPLAQSFGRILDSGNLLTQISVMDKEQVFDRAELTAFGASFRMAKPSAGERQLLISTILPSKTNLQSELNRIASYCLLLHLSGALGRVVSEADVYAAASQHSLDGTPEELHSICDGWVQFAVRDLLVFTHEAAVASVLLQLSQVSGPEKRQPAEEVVSAIVSHNLDSALAGLGITSKADQPISELCTSVSDALGQSVELRGLRRWRGELSEAHLFAKEAWLRQPDGLGLLPISWIIAGHRLEPGIQAQNPGFELIFHAGFSRLGVDAVVLPEVRSWRTSSKTTREITAWLIHRSVDQHLRIAWSRLAREPFKDVAVIRSDGDDWVYQKNLNPGRATSRLYQAINWLRQLELLDDNGTTTRGSEVLQAGLETLRQASRGLK